MKPEDVAQNLDPPLLDVLGGDDVPRVIFVIRHRRHWTNADLRAIGVSNYPGRTPGLPDDDPLWPPKR